MIEKGRTDLADQIRTYIAERRQIMVYYDRFVGFKGISSPQLAPIVKIESLNKFLP